MKKTILLFSALLLLCGTMTVYAFTTDPRADTAPRDTENAGNAPVTQMAAAQSYDADPVPDKEAYEVYAPYGLTYREATQKLYYEGELVRCFDDLTRLDEMSTVGIEYYCEAGTVDVSALRDPDDITYYPGGGYDPKGRLTGLQRHTDAQFAQRDVSDRGRAADTAVAAEGVSMSPEALGELYAEYEAFGVTYDKNTDTLFYEGQPVRAIFDIMRSNGGDPENGTFSGSLRNAGSRDGGTVDLYTVRDFEKPNTEGNGSLTGIEPYSQEEFERRTDAVWIQSEVQPG